MEKKKQINLTLYYFISLVYLEIVFKILTFGFKNILNSHILVMLIFLGILSAILGLLSKIFKNKKINLGITLFLLFLLCTWFSISFVFKKIFNTFFCISLFGLTDQAVAFTSQAIIEILKSSYGIIILFIPFIIMAILRFNNFSKHNEKELLVNSLILFGLSPLLLGALYINKENDYSAYKLFNEIDNNSLNVEKLGVSIATYLDCKRLIFGFDEKILYDDFTSEEDIKIENTVYEKNNLDIDFNNLINNEQDKTLLDMHNYFFNQTGTYKNSYTGYFQDKNLIVIMAESFNTIALHPELTPTLYKLANSGFIFQNFYTPVNLSTIGGEFQDLTGLFANLNTLNSYWRKGKNYFPFGLGTVFNNLNYQTTAYHANSGYFQDRNIYLKSIGFDNFIYNGNGLEKKMNTNIWPQSDLDLINVTVDDYINSDKFMTYYISVSGHMPYTQNGNAITKKNWDLVKDLDLSNDAKGYLAANIELDLAVKSLIDKLEANNKLDDTVIAIIPDHYPYNLDLKTINELSTYQRDSIVEINHSTLILWNNKMEPVYIDKTCSQLDFIPTLYNLFGINYDSRLFMGSDILSTEEGLVFFTNRSWVTDKGTYYASNNTFIPKNEETISNDYIDNIQKKVSNKINMSKLIIEKDYYKKILGSD